MRARNATIIIALAAIVGLVDAALLTWDHQVHRVDPSATSALCGKGEGCDIARFHPLSEFSLGPERPGLPISLIALGAYLACFSLAVRRWRFKRERESPRLLFMIALVSGLYSAFLAFASLMIQGGFCKLCTILYAVNFILLSASFVGLGETMADFASGFVDALLSRAAAAAAVPMVATLILGYASMRHRSLRLRARSKPSSMRPRRSRRLLALRSTSLTDLPWAKRAHRFTSSSSPTLAAAIAGCSSSSFTSS